MLCMGLVLAQQEGGINKRLRFRRPKPQLTDIANPEGDEAGPPIPLRRVPAGTTNYFKRLCQFHKKLGHTRNYARWKFGYTNHLAYKNKIYTIWLLKLIFWHKAQKMAALGWNLALITFTKLTPCWHYIIIRLLHKKEPITPPFLTPSVIGHILATLPQISNRERYSISNINQQLTICQQMLKIWYINLFL